MFCPKCGSELYGAVSECPFCGAPVSETDKEHTTGQKKNKSNPYSKLFVDQSEKTIAVIGDNFATGIIRGNGISSSYGILTDKRCYFKATCYSSTGSSVTKSKDQWTIDLRDITASGFKYTSNVMYIILSLISAVLCLFSLMMITEESGYLFPIITGIAAVLFFVVYYLSRTTLYAVYFAGGGITIDIASFEGTGDIDYFDKQLRTAKNAIVDK